MKVQPGTPINLDTLTNEGKIYLPILRVVTPKEAEPVANYGAMLVMGVDENYYLYAMGNFSIAGWDKLDLPKITNRNIMNQVDNAKVETR